MVLSYSVAFRRRMVTRPGAGPAALAPGPMSPTCPMQPLPSNRADDRPSHRDLRVVNTTSGGHLDDPGAYSPGRKPGRAYPLRTVLAAAFTAF